MRLIAVVSLVVALAVPSAGAGPVTQDACPGERTSTSFASGKGVLENLGFDGQGNLFVSGDSKLTRYRPDGSSQVVLSGLRSPGGIAFRDGVLYLGIGNALADAYFATGAAEVWEVSGAAGDVAEVTHRVFGSGFDMPNGMVFGPDGSLYASNDFGPGPVKIAPDGSSWTNLGVYGTNGMVIDGGRLHAAITFDQTSPIKSMTLDGGDVQTEASLSFGALSLEPAVVRLSDPLLPLVPKGLDDMTSGGPGVLVVTANGSGELLRVSDGVACVLASGLGNPSSVRQAVGFGDWDGAWFVTDFRGNITVVR